MKTSMVIFLAFKLFSCNKDKPSQAQPAPSPTESPAAEKPDDIQVLGKPNLGDIDLVDISSIVGGNAGDSRLIGGTPADPKDWPASFTTTQGSSRCTGTVLGPQTLQLAAHCVGNGKTASVTSAGVKHVGICTHHSKYQSDATSDYALCYLSNPILLPWFESVLSSGEELKIGSEIILAGMGCVQAGGGGGNDNVFRVGKAPVVRLPNSDNDIVTSGSSALCFGDSGGSAFFKNSSGVLKVAGINSRGDIRKISYLPAVYTKSARDFYIAWATKNNTLICGVSEGATNCRGESVPPPPPPNPSPVPAWCADTFKKIDKCIFGDPRISLTDPEGCRNEYAKLFACQIASENDQ